MYRLRAFFFGVNFRSLPPATVTRLRQLGLKLSPPALSRVAQDSDAKGFAQGASDELANADFIDRSAGAMIEVVPESLCIEELQLVLAITHELAKPGVATYGVVDLKVNLGTSPPPLRAELAHLRVEAQPELMSADEREEAVAALRKIADQLAH
jgi:hypothetical protein